jgi:Flp pilus assembly protein TadG
MRQANERQIDTRPLIARFIRVVRVARRSGRGLAREQHGGIMMIAAISFTVLIGMAALAVDLGAGYLTKLADQHVADSAAFAGALAYNTSGSTTTMNSAVGNLMTLNGLAANTATAGVVSSPNGDGNSAVQVIVATNAPQYLAEVFRGGSTMAVSATSYAEIKVTPPACIIALQTGSTGLTLSGGTTVTASTCTVASNATVSVPCGTKIITKALDYDSAAVPSQPCSGITPPSGTASVNIVKTLTSDPLASNAAVTAAFTHLGSITSQTGPSGPTVTSGTTLVFGYGTPTPSQLLTIGCTGNFSSPVWTVTCPAGGTYNFGGISLGGGITLNFAVGAGGSSTNTYNFSGAIDISGSGATFGPGTYNVAGGIINGGGATTTFNAGTYNIGSGTVSCSGSYYSICNTGSSMTFGAGSYTIAGGIYNGGSAPLSIGAGSTANSFNIGAGSAGYAINASSSGATTFGDMGSGTFKTVGTISSAGGSTLVLSAAPAHDLKGAFTLAGSATLGAGTYTVAGNFSLGQSGGGGSVTGNSVSIITSGTFTVAAGYNNVTLNGPSSGTLQFLVVASNGTGGASFSEGASGNSLSGAFYFPGAPISLSGAGNVGNGTGQCLELIGSTVTLSGGSALASTCVGLAGGGSGGAKVVLVQ